MEKGLVKLLGLLFFGVGVILAFDSMGVPQIGLTGHVISNEGNSETFIIISMALIFIGLLHMALAYGKIKLMKGK